MLRLHVLVLLLLFLHAETGFLPQPPRARPSAPLAPPRILRHLLTTIEEAAVASSRRLDCIDGEGHTATAASDRDGSWFTRPALLHIQNLLADIALNPADAVVDRWLARAPWPTFVNITSVPATSAYELSLFGIPAGQALAPRRHQAGTILIYRRVAGDLRMRSLIHAREVGVEAVTDDPLVRLAGKTVVFESMDGRFAAVLELAVFPPRRVEEGFGAASGFDTDALARVCQVDLDASFAERLFRPVPVPDAAADDAARQRGKKLPHFSWRKAPPR